MMRRELVNDEDGFRDVMYADMDDLHTLADYCKALHNEGKTGQKDMPHLAEYPAEIVEKYCADAGITFSEWMRNPDHVQRMLRDPALAAFRINAQKV